MQDSGHKTQKPMDRRAFLYKSTAFLAGSVLGLNSFASALAQEGTQTNSLHKPRIALIIDDIGFSFSAARRFLDLRVPLTFSVLPRLPKSYELALEIHSTGHEVMLHQPMEPHDTGFDPGPGALYTGDKTERITRVIEDNLSGMPLAIGVNNHMGSRFTECPREIRDTLHTIKAKGLFFVDSLTSYRSKAFTVAKYLHMTAAYRNVFLDNVPDESAIISQLRLLENRARKFGSAVGIGHPFPETVRAIDAFSRDIKHPDVSLVHITKVLAT
ncbi:divergent polysaccharide deacetylase family protein [Thermodesulfobacteriota bacterium]